MEFQWKTNPEIAPNCPRCASHNTKFCYYNNYSLSQPRYFCKGCRRYWTKGGSLRNIPVGGGCRKSRRAKSVKPPPSTTTTTTHAHAAQNSPDDTNSMPGSSGSTNGSDIDLALVFAKYLNPNSTGSDPAQEASMHADVTRVGPEFMGHDPNGFGFDEFVGCDHDQVVDDGLWSEDPNPDFSWESMGQLQDQFGSFSCYDDDQMNISQNLICDNWSAFDLSGLEIFTRP